MPENEDLVPREGKLVATDPGAEAGSDEVVSKMSELLQVALTSLMLQQVEKADTAARTAEALYDATKRDTSPDELAILEVFKDLISLYAPLTRAVVFQTEGRFARAREELAKGLAKSVNAIAGLDTYASLPNADKEIAQTFKPLFSILQILFRGMDPSMRAEMFGYQGNIRKYTELLREAMAEFRKAELLPSNLNPMFLSLVSFCASFAERLQTRIEVFSSWPDKDYLIPTGNKIFIIHGQEEAKWRELRDLLKDELDQKTIVLKEEPGAGETLN